MSLKDVRPLSVVRRRPSTISKISETAGPVKAKLHVWHPQEGGTKVNINGPGHMTKIAAMPIYGKNHKKNLIWNRWTDFNETWFVASGTMAHHSLYKS